MNDETAITIYTGGDKGATSYQESIPSLEQSSEDWVTESARSGSQRTITTCRGIITGFRAHLQGKHLDLDHSPVAVAAVAREWLNARPVSWATFNQRRSILSSLFMYALRNEVEHIQANPIERIKARKPGAIKTALAAIDRSTAQGLRDYALLSVALTMGHRASWQRCDSSTCTSRERSARSAGSGARAMSRVHTTRHTAAVNLSHQKGVTLEQVRRFLGHQNAKTTSDYRREKQMKPSTFSQPGRGISLSMAGTAVQKPYVMHALWGYTSASNIGHRMSDH